MRGPDGGGGAWRALARAASRPARWRSARARRRRVRARPGARAGQGAALPRHRRTTTTAARHRRLRGDRRGATASPSTPPPTRRRSGPRDLEPYRAVVFLNTAGDLLDDEQEGALEAFIEDGGGFLGIGSAAQSELGTEFFDGLIGARPSAASSTDAVGADGSSPAIACTRRRRTCRSRPTAPTSGTSGRRARPGRCTPSRATTRRTRRPATARTPAARTPRSRGAATTRAAARSTPGMGRTAGELRRGRLPRTTCWARCVDRRARPRQLQGDDQQQLQGARRS